MALARDVPRQTSLPKVSQSQGEATGVLAGCDRQPVNLTRLSAHRKTCFRGSYSTPAADTDRQARPYGELSAGFSPACLQRTSAQSQLRCDSCFIRIAVYGGGQSCADLDSAYDFSISTKRSAMVHITMDHSQLS